MLPIDIGMIYVLLPGFIRSAELQDFSVIKRNEEYQKGYRKNEA